VIKHVFGFLSFLSIAICVTSCTAGKLNGVFPARADGRIEPTTYPLKNAPKTMEERIAQIEKAASDGFELIAKLPPPTTFAVRVEDGAMRIDGKLTEVEWGNARIASGFRLTFDLKPESLPTEAKLLWDSKYLYIAFAGKDVDLVGTIAERDGDYWREDAFEVFVDANADGMSYLEFEVNPLGLLYDASLADYRPEVNWARNQGHLDIGKSRMTYDTADTKVAVELDGTLNESGDVDKGWTCELAVSWEDIAAGTNVVRVPPRDGDVWSIGFYRVNVSKDQETNPSEYAAWNPTTSWYHVPWLFGRAVFVE